MAAKYSYLLSNEELLAIIQAVPTPEISKALLDKYMSDPTLFRAKMAIPRFFADEANNYFVLVATILQKRLADGNGMGDIADMLGKNINQQKLMMIANSILQKTISQDAMVALNKDLTEDEKITL